MAATESHHHGRFVDLNRGVSLRRRGTRATHFTDAEYTVRNTIAIAVVCDALTLGFLGFYSFGEEIKDGRDLLFLTLLVIIGGVVAVASVLYGFFQRTSNLIVRWVNSKTPTGWALAVVVGSIGDILTGIPNEKIVVILLWLILAWVPRYRLYYRQDETAFFDGLLLEFPKLIFLFANEGSWIKAIVSCFVVAMVVYCKRIKNMAPTNDIGQFWSVVQDGTATDTSQNTLEELIGPVDVENMV